MNNYSELFITFEIRGQAPAPLNTALLLQTLSLLYSMGMAYQCTRGLR